MIILLYGEIFLSKTWFVLFFVDVPHGAAVAGVVVLSAAAVASCVDVFHGATVAGDCYVSHGAAVDAAALSQREDHIIV